MMAQELESKRERRSNDNQRSVERHTFPAQDQRGADGGGQAGEYCGSLRKGS